MFRIVLSLVLFMLSVGFVCPALISMKNTIAVIVGILILTMSGFSIYFILKPLFKG